MRGRPGLEDERRSSQSPSRRKVQCKLGRTLQGQRKSSKRRIPPRTIEWPGSSQDVERRSFENVF